MFYIKKYSLRIIQFYLTKTKSAPKALSKDLFWETKKTLRLSNRTPLAFTIHYDLLKTKLQNLRFKLEQKNKGNIIMIKMLKLFNCLRL